MRSRRQMWTAALSALGLSLGLALGLGALGPLSAAPAYALSATAVSPATSTSADTAFRLEGVFRLAPATCGPSGPDGSWLQELAMEDLVVGNPSSSCVRGSYTLLSPGTAGVFTSGFSVHPASDFDADGNSQDGSIAAPVLFDGHRLGLATAAADVQDDPSGPALYRPPTAALNGTTLSADLRSLFVTYDGAPGTSCASGHGRGCWQVGTRTAEGGLDRRTGAFVLDWTTGQGFAPGAAGTRLHLEGTFSGRLLPAGGGAPVVIGAAGPSSAGGALDPAKSAAGSAGSGAGSAMARAAGHVGSAGGAAGNSSAGAGGRRSPSRPVLVILASIAATLCLGVAIVLARRLRLVPAEDRNQRWAGRQGWRRRWAALLALGGLLGACGGHGSADPRVLSGQLRLSAGVCAGSKATPTGSWLEVIDEADNKVIDNPSGGCANPHFTVLGPGTDGGLWLGRFQPAPDPTFDNGGNSLAARIAAPVSFGSFRMGLATDGHDEQDAPSGAAAFPPPRATVSGSRLTVDLRSLNFTYEGPAGRSCSGAAGMGCYQLGSRSASGTYDPATRRFSLQWFVGESFMAQGDSMIVHLSGVVSASSTAVSGAASPDARLADAVVAREVPAAGALPAAMAEVPVAMAEVASTTAGTPSPAARATAQALLRRRPELRALAGAVGQSQRFALPLRQALTWAAAGPRAGQGRASVTASSVAVCLDQLQTVYEEVVPALQVAAAGAGRPASAAAVLAVVAADPGLGELHRFLTGLDSLYGAGVLAERALG